MSQSLYLQAVRQFAALSGLSVRAHQEQTLVPSSWVWRAVGDLSGSLQPESGHLDQFQRVVEGLKEFEEGERFSPVVVLTLLRDFQARGILPVTGQDPAQAFAEINPKTLPNLLAPADALSEGADTLYPMATIRGFAPWPVFPGQEALSTSPSAEASQATALPLIDPETGKFVIEGIHFSLDGSVEGVVLSDYKLDRPIGLGGNSRVYKAQETGPDRPVAVKVVSFPDEERREVFKTAFQNERQLQGALRSERFVHVYSTGRTAQGNPFIAMEFLPGGSLAEFIRRIERNDLPFDLAQVMSLARQATAAVAEAQRQGILHRDVKPENFFLTEDLKVKLGDFGIAARLASISEDVESFSGTPGFIPPENMGIQAQRPAEPDTLRRDVFALGVTLYEMLTGVFPFEDNTVMRVLMKVARHDPPAPSEVRPERNIPPLLDRIVMKAMAKNPEERYADAEELLFDITTFQAQAFEEAAREALQKIEGDRLRRRIHRGEWRARLQDAFREYRRSYDEYPNERIRERLVAIHLDLHRWADEVGDDNLLLHSAEGIRDLAPESPAAIEVDRRIHINITLDGTPPRPLAMQTLAIQAFAEHAGVLKPEGTVFDEDRIPSNGIDLNRGAHELRYTMEGAMPLTMNLPARPGDYEIRIPLYPVSLAPAGWALVPAGPVAVKKEIGSYSESVADAREVEHDFFIGPPVTIKLWNEFLEHIQEERGDAEMAKRVPANWHWDRANDALIDSNGNPIDGDAPVTHVRYGHFLEFFRVMMPKARPATLNEWKRALRGNDARPWPWGNVSPDADESLVAGCRHLHHADKVAPLSNLARGLSDYSPFSHPHNDPARSGMIPHVALNVLKLISWPEGREDRERILRAVGQGGIDPDDPTIPERFVFLVGGSYDQPAPTNVEMIRVELAGYTGPAGVIPVIPLNKAKPTPTVASLTRTREN